MEILKDKTSGLLRADSGFGNQRVLSFLEAKNMSYLRSCTLYANLLKAIYDIKTWNSIGLGLFITELSYQQGGWDKARGIIIIKQSEEIRPEARGKKLRTLFDHVPGYDEKVYPYKYQTMVRN